MAKINMEPYRQQQWEIQQAAIAEQKKTEEFIRRRQEQIKEQWAYQDQRKQQIDAAYGTISKYGEASASLACEMYNSIAQKEEANVPEAEPAEIASYDEIAQAIVGTTPDQHAGVVGRFVKQAGEDTMLQNAARDGAEFAWTPGGTGCAFCLVLASRGWQHVSKRTLRKMGPDGNWIHAKHIHPNCKCEYSIRFSEDTDVDGYDPEKYLEWYNQSEGTTPDEKIASLRQDLGGKIKIEDAMEEQKNYTNRADTLVDAIMNNHRSLRLFTPAEMKETLERHGYEIKPLGHVNYKGITFEDGGGFRTVFGGNGYFQYHPAERSHHQGAYWKVMKTRGGAHYELDGSIKELWSPKK